MRKKATHIMTWGIWVMIACIVSVGAIDYSRVKSFEMPYFAVDKTVGDNGAERYTGLGYSFVLEGSFKPEDELSGVTRYEYFILGRLISTGVRD